MICSDSLFCDLISVLISLFTLKLSWPEQYAVLKGCKHVFWNKWIGFISWIAQIFGNREIQEMRKGKCVRGWEGCYCMKLDGVSLKHEHSSLLRHKALSDCRPPPPDANKQIWVSSPSQTHTQTHGYIPTGLTHTITSPHTYTHMHIRSQTQTNTPPI